MPPARDPVRRRKKTRRAPAPKPSQGRRGELLGKKDTGGKPTRPARKYDLPKTDPFGPKPGSGPALHKQRREQRDKVRRAEDNAVAKGARPKVETKRYPTLKKYTPAQRRTIIREQGKAISKAEVKAKRTVSGQLTHKGGEVSREDAQALDRLTDKRTRRAIAQYQGAVRTEVKAGRREPDRHDSAGVDLSIGRKAKRGAFAPEVIKAAKEGKKTATLKSGLKVSTAGVSTGDSASKLARIVVGIPAHTVKETIDNPGRALKANTRFVRDTAKGLITAPGQLLKPGKLVKDTVKDAKKFYGPAVRGDFKKFRKNVGEQGALRVALDASVVAGPAGAVAGRGATVAARSGKLGLTAKSRARRKTVATAPRPALRISGNVTKPQAKSKNYFKAARQQKKDNRRALKRDRIAGEAALGGKRGDAVQITAARRTREGSPEVVPGRLARKQKLGVARLKSRSVARLRSEQNNRINRFAGDRLNRLSADERKAFYYVAAGLVPADPTRAAAHIDRRADSIKANREVKGLPAQFGGQRSKRDELATLAYLKEHPEAFSSKLRDTVRELRRQDVEVAANDPRLASDQILLRRHSQQAAHLGVARGEGPAPTTPGGLPGLAKMEGETTVQFVRRVRKAADAEGLERPLYFPSEKWDPDDAPDFAGRAVGGTDASPRAFQYTGRLFRAGAQNTDPRVYLQGLARSIKAKHNYRLVADTMDKNAFDGLKDMPIRALKDELEKRGIAMDSVAFWSPGVYRDRVASTERRDTDEREGFDRDEDYDEDDIRSALADSTITGDELERRLTRKNDPSLEYMMSQGWSVVPRNVHDEVHASKPSNRTLQAAGRKFDIVKGKQSRLMLGAANIPWLQFQVASNMGLSALATKGTGALDAVRAQRWYKKLPDADKETVDALVGGGMGFDGTLQTKLGAAAKGDLLDGYRRFKAAPFWDAGPRVAGRQATLRKANPIDAMFALDQKQNAVFRRSVLYNSVRRSEPTVRAIMREQDRLFGGKAEARDKAITGVLRDPEAIERHAEHVDDWLGDYTTYTQTERATLQRFTLFYGFLRHSTRLASQTVPTQHPIMAAIMAKLAQLKVEEVKELLGPDSYQWGLGKVFLPGGKAIDLAKMNPAVNSVVGANKPAQLIGLVPQPFGMAVDQATSRSNFLDRPYRTNGKPATYAADWSSYDLGDRGRIAADDLASMLYPYRLGKNLTQTGPQGDDSLLGSERETQYKKKEIRKSVGASKDFEAAQSPAAKALYDLAPFVPRPDNSVEESKLRAAQDAKKTKGKKTKAKKPRYFGSGATYPRTRSKPRYFGAGG